MRRITESELVQVIFDRHREYFENEISLGKDFATYRYEMFETDMLASHLVVDPRTIKAKWKILKANEIIEIRSGRECVNLSKLYPFVRSDVKSLMRGRESERERYVAGRGSE